MFQLGKFAVALLGLGAGCLVSAQGRLVVDVDKPGVKISPTFYGLMTEEINHSYDGGLYAELVQNRHFADNAETAKHWSLVQSSGVEADLMLARPAGGALDLHVSSNAPGQSAGIANDGYWGIPVLPDTRYHARIDAAFQPGSEGPLEVSIESKDGQTVYAKTRISRIAADLHTYDVTLQTHRVTPTVDARFVLRVSTPGNHEFGFVSLFPPTYRNRPNGLRPDLMNLLSQMNPAFLRLPGGNYLEGDHIADRFNWEATLGDIAKRKGHQGPWGYRSSDGLGLLEFLTWCEDLKMQPVLAVYAGYSLAQDHVEPGPALTPYVQSAIDEIEFLTGDASTKGKLRIELGHRKPFPLTYVEVGNEDIFDRSRSYDARFAQFYDAIKAKWPNLKVIATMPVASRKPDVVDDHYYRSAEAMERDAHHYDGYSRKGPKIFVGEWASTQGQPTPTLEAALGDAAWLTGLERNSDLVVMEAYAPLLVNVNPGASQWGTNLIGYDALRSFGSPSFYVQSMFGRNAGDMVLPTHVTQPTRSANWTPVPHGAIGLGTWRTNSVYRNASVTQGDRRVFPVKVGDGMEGWALTRGVWRTGNGELHQTSEETNTQASVGSRGWSNYTYRVQARKVSGAEGFLIQFHVEDDQNFWQWNIGGWENSRTAIQRIHNGAAEEVGPSANVTIKPGHWYDVRIELQDRHIRCYLDDQLLNETIEVPRGEVDPIYATSSRDLKTGDIILKIVNVSAEAQRPEVVLNGAPALGTHAHGWQLTGRPRDVNTVAEPTKVAPKPVTVEIGAPSFSPDLPAYSVTVLRIPVVSGGAMENP